MCKRDELNQPLDQKSEVRTIGEPDRYTLNQIILADHLREMLSGTYIILCEPPGK